MQGTELGRSAEPWVTPGQSRMATVLIHSPRGTSGSPLQKGSEEKMGVGVSSRKLALLQEGCWDGCQVRGLRERGRGRTTWAVVPDTGEMNSRWSKVHWRPSTRPYSLNRCFHPQICNSLLLNTVSPGLWPDTKMAAQAFSLTKWPVQGKGDMAGTLCHGRVTLPEHRPYGRQLPLWVPEPTARGQGLLEGPPPAEALANHWETPHASGLLTPQNALTC